MSSRSNLKRSKVRNTVKAAASSPKKPLNRNPPAGHTVRRYVLLFSLVCLAYLVTVSDRYVGLIGDGRDMFDTAVSLRHFGELLIPADHYPNPEIERYAKYGLGFSLVQQLPLTFAAPLEIWLGQGRSNVLFAMTNLLLTAFASLMIALSVRDLGFRFATAVCAALAYSLATFAWPYISYDFSEPLQAFCVIASFWCLLQAVKLSPPSWFWLSLTGLVLGYGVLTKAYLLILIPSYALYLWTSLDLPVRQKTYSLARFALPLGALGLVIGSLNLYRFGSVFDFGYGSESTWFTTPLATGLYGLLLGPNKGLLFYAPVVILLPWSLCKLFRNWRREFIFFVSVFTLYVLPTSMWWSWEGGASWGPRLLLPILPLLVVCAATLLETAKGAFIPFIGCVIVGIGINLLGILMPFVVWGNLLSLGGARVPLDIAGRPNAEYVERGGKKWFPMYVAINYLPSLSPILGHAWLLRLRYFETPFALSKLQSDAAQPLEPVPFSPIEIDFAALKGAGGLGDEIVQQLDSAQFWFWETIIGNDRAERSSSSIYGHALVRQGNRAMARKDAERARVCYENALKLIPDSGIAAINLSQAQLQVGRVFEAQQTLVQFLKRRPQEPFVRLLLARLYETTGNRENALAVYLDFLTRHPDNEDLPLVQRRIAELSAHSSQ